MAVTYGFFNSVNGDRKYNADQMSEYFRGIVSQGVFQHLDSGLAVSAGTGLSVSVAAGRAIIQDRWIQNSAALNLTILAASETYGRKDAVVIRLDKSSRAISITVKTGTPAASPVAPSMTRNATTYEMALAYVNVAAGASSVTVTDKRSDSSVCGWAAVAQATSGEVDQMLNAMKTGFDGVVYSSPAAMVQGEDQNLMNTINVEKRTISVGYNSLHQDSTNIYVLGGRWGNETYVSDINYRTVVVPLRGVYSLEIEITPAAIYTNPYTFVDESFHCVSHAPRKESATNYSGSLKYSDFPDGATHICFTFQEDNLTVTVSAFSSFFEDKKGLFEIEPIILRKMCYIGANRSEGNDFCCSVFYVKDLDRIRIDYKTDQYINEYTFLDDGLGKISHVQYNESTSKQKSIIVDVPSNAVWCAVSNRVANIDTSSVFAVWNDYADACKLIGTKYYGKTIVWLGTSIPAGGFFGYNSPISYPALVGSKIGAYVINEAVGSSDIHCRIPNRVSESNPYGFENNFESASRCLSNTITMMNWIKEHYNDGTFTQNVPASITTEYSAQMNRCSYEQKIDRYLADGCEPDYWVFDHGRNDNMNYESEFDANATLDGVVSNYGYGHGHLIEGDGKKVSFDVSDLDIVYIDYLTTIYYDYWDLLDENGNVISYSDSVAYANDLHVQTFLDVSSAATLVISTKNTSSVVVKSQSALLSTFYYQGAMNFIMNRIKEYNPKSRIIMIGHYENQLYKAVCDNQINVSNYWSIPLLRLWEILGWSQKVVKTTGGWTDGYWDADKNPNGTYMTELNIALPDGLHPHRDLSGNTLRYEADHITEWIKNYSKINE